MQRRKSLVKPHSRSNTSRPRNSRVPPTPRLGSRFNPINPSQKETSIHSSSRLFRWVQNKISWSFFARAITCCIPSSFLTQISLTNSQVQQAWREKVALCMIIGFLMFWVGFFTFGLRPLLCASGTERNSLTAYYNQSNPTTIPYRDEVLINGYMFPFTQTQQLLAPFGVNLTSDWHGMEISGVFSSDCSKIPLNCVVPNRFQGSPALSPTSCISRESLRNLNPIGRLYFNWDELDANLLVFNGLVVNITRFYESLETNNLTLSPNLNRLKLEIDGDSSYLISSKADLLSLSDCILRYSVGVIDSRSPACVAADIIMALTLIVVLGVVATKFILAVAFHLLSGSDSPSPNRTRSWSVNTLVQSDDPDVLVLVTCYSEDEHGIGGTLRSIAQTDYQDNNKLIFVICDGIITGSGNSMSTPDIVVSMMNLHPECTHEPRDYLAISQGSGVHNMARVYYGTFDDNKRKLPMIAVVKCGTPSETTKPGNRGKRDSQVLLMNFLSRILFRDRCTELDHSLYKAFLKLGKTPEKFDHVLMIDSDTVIAHDSLKHLINAMNSDPQIIGVCGETKIANKRESWVTMIQVFEYYISHHLGKSFESIFGGVTCLPGCFSMYRIKSSKGKYMTPFIVSPNILDEYSENVVDTLHQKNLLLLGEDRFLTTLLLKKYPKRKLMFVPAAICHTTAPSTFKVLLSQRRRWINSTIHNLLELVQVSDLCGIFCFSMQFVIALELLGTVIMPAAITFSIIMFLQLIFTQNVDPLPLVILLCVLLLPSLLIIFLKRKLSYVFWLGIYLLALPVWNFVLPLYAFWRFDDFSWGETRKVDGEEIEHGVVNGEFRVGSVVLKYLFEWDQSGNQVQSYESLQQAVDTEIRSSLPKMMPKYSDLNKTTSEEIEDYPARNQYANRTEIRYPKKPLSSFPEKMKPVFKNVDHSIQNMEHIDSLSTKELLDRSRLHIEKLPSRSQPANNAPGSDHEAQHLFMNQTEPTEIYHKNLQSPTETQFFHRHQPSEHISQWQTTAPHPLISNNHDPSLNVPQLFEFYDGSVAPMNPFYDNHYYTYDYADGHTPYYPNQDMMNTHTLPHFPMFQYYIPNYTGQLLSSDVQGDTSLRYPNSEQWKKKKKAHSLADKTSLAIEDLNEKTLPPLPSEPTVADYTEVSIYHLAPQGELSVLPEAESNLSNIVVEDEWDLSAIRPSSRSPSLLSEDLPVRNTNHIDQRHSALKHAPYSVSASLARKIQRKAIHGPRPLPGK